MAARLALPRHQTIVPIARATGSTNIAFRREETSEILPMSGGEIRSPNKWMANIDKAIALARSVSGTPCRMTTLIGDVDKKMANSATAMETKKPRGECAKRQAIEKGTLAR